jgi:hypothetical protein
LQNTMHYRLSILHAVYQVAIFLKVHLVNYDEGDLD